MNNDGNEQGISGGGAVRVNGGSASIINNTFACNRSAYVGTGGRGLGGGAIFSTGQCAITNNVFYDNRANNGWSVYAVVSGSATLSYCDAYNPGQSNTQANHYYSPGSVSNMMYSDPLFVDPGHWNDPGTPSDWSDDTWVNGDYHLQSDSPRIDQGTNTNAPAEDIDGNPRPVNVTCDMGAYEYMGQ
ncbi:MAG: choice-of-anchor Q domain-containing protein [Armatimonadota bacterium]|nr:choice-of-anchor Q domain-containing protein [Armatimonadota bacterium]